MAALVARPYIFAWPFMNVRSHYTKMVTHRTTIYLPTPRDHRGVTYRDASLQVDSKAAK